MIPVPVPIADVLRPKNTVRYDFYIIDKVSYFFKVKLLEFYVSIKKVTNNKDKI